MAEDLECLPKLIGRGQQSDAEVVLVRDVETAAGGNEDVLLLDQVQRKDLVVKIREVDLHEGVHGPCGEKERCGGPNPWP